MELPLKYEYEILKCLLSFKRMAKPGNFPLDVCKTALKVFPCSLLIL